jgi:hypothetical protein
MAACSTIPRSQHQQPAAHDATTRPHPTQNPTHSPTHPFPTPKPPLAPPAPQATLFLSSNHHTIINLFSIGHNPGQPFIVHFTKASLICYLIIYVILMSVGAGVAIPGGLFMPSLIVGSSWGALFGMQLRDWLPGWNIQPGVYALMAGTGGWFCRVAYSTACSCVVYTLSSVRADGGHSWAHARVVTDCSRVGVHVCLVFVQCASCAGPGAHTAQQVAGGAEAGCAPAHLAPAPASWM